MNLVWGAGGALWCATYRGNELRFAGPQRIGEAVAALALAQEPRGGFALATLDLPGRPGRASAATPASMAASPTGPSTSARFSPGDLPLLGNLDGF